MSRPERMAELLAKTTNTGCEVMGAISLSSSWGAWLELAAWLCMSRNYVCVLRVCECVCVCVRARAGVDEFMEVFVLVRESG